MKFINYDYWLNEKFTDESDPIHDMGIGIKHQYEKWAERHLSGKEYYTMTALIVAVDEKEYDFVKYLLAVANLDLNKRETFHDRGTVLRYAAARNDVKMLKLLIDAGANPNYVNDGMFLYMTSMGVSEETIKFCLKEIEKWNKIHKETKINEKFTDESDPIKDMGIGRIHRIKKWLDSVHVSEYKINDDGTIDTYQRAILQNLNLIQLPEYIQFGKITNGYFSISNNNLITLRGCPQIVDKGDTEYNGDFDCSHNNLTSLEFAPISITGSFVCNNNSKEFTKEDIKKYCKQIGHKIYNT
jgi:Ankyrin repeats (3 copies)